MRNLSIFAFIIISMKCFGNAEVNQNFFDGNDYFNALYNGTNWCASILVGLPYHVDTEFLRTKPLNHLEVRTGVDYTDHHELGAMEDIDFCCHSYHHCVESLPDLYDIDVENPKKAQHCDCDSNLRQCLRQFNTPASNDFGRVYFFMTEQCLLNDYPVVGCEQHDLIFEGTDEQESRCIGYMVDESESKQYQFFDLPFYYNEQERQRLRVDF